MAYDWKITAKKMLIQFGWIALSGALTIGIDYITALPSEEQAGLFGILLIVFRGLENWAKNRNKS